MELADLGLGTTHLLIDHGAKYAQSFDAVFEAQEVEVMPGRAAGAQHERLRRALGADPAPGVPRSVPEPRRATHRCALQLPVGPGDEDADASGRLAPVRGVREAPLEGFGDRVPAAQE